jgi:phage shock protein PspC (stress-responsive transcriptional regulator)
MAKKNSLSRSRSDRVIAGICGGLGNYFDIDPIIFRILFVLLVVFGGSGVLIYIILWIVVPEEGEAERKGEVSEKIKEGANKMAEEIKESSPDTKHSGRALAGIIVILVGLMFLGQNFIPRWYINFWKLWPLLIVVVGVSIIIGSGKNDEGKEGEKSSSAKGRKEKR